MFKSSGLGIMPFLLLINLFFIFLCNLSSKELRAVYGPGPCTTCGQDHRLPSPNCLPPSNSPGASCDVLVLSQLSEGLLQCGNFGGPVDTVNVLYRMDATAKPLGEPQKVGGSGSRRWVAVVPRSM